MEFEHKRLKGWLPWLLAAVVLALFLVQLRVVLNRADYDWQVWLQNQTLMFDQGIKAQHDLAIQQSSVVAHLIAKDAVMVNLIQQEMRRNQAASQNNSLTTKDQSALDGQSPASAQNQLPPLQRKLQDATQSYWSTLAQLGATHLTVYSSDGTVLYRSHQPERFGDKMGAIRPMLAELYKTRQSQEGLDVGRYGSAYRTLVPVFDLPEYGMQVMGVIEVGFGLLPATKPAKSSLEKSRLQTTNLSDPKISEAIKLKNKTNPFSTQPATELDTPTGHAVLMSSEFANEVLWADTRQRIYKQSSGARSPWLIESATDGALKVWQEKGLFLNPLLALDKPFILTEGNQHYLIASNRPAIFVATTGFQSRLEERTSQPQLLIVNWRDITPEFFAYQKNSQQILIHWILACLLAEIILWFLFSLQNRRIRRLLRDHHSQLKKERDLSKQSEERLVLALASSDSGFWEWDIANNRANFSQQWREMCGLSADESTSGDMEDWLERVHPSDKRASYDAMIRHVKGETTMFENEYRLRVANGTYKWIFTRGKVVEWQPDGKAALMLGVYTDITERKKNEITVIRQQGALHALNEIAAIPSLDAEDQLRRALEVGSNYLGLNIGVISSVQGNQYQVRLQVNNKIARSQLEVEALSNHFCEYTFRKQDIFFVDDVAASEYIQHRAHTLSNLQSYIGVPIYLKGKIYGTLSFSAETVRAQAYDNLDKDFMWLMSRWVSVTMERWQYQTEQKQFIERFNKLCNQLPGFLFQFQIDADGNRSCPYSSAGIYEIYGLLPEEVTASADKLFSRIHKEDVAWLEQTIAESKENMTPWVASYRVNNRTRGELWVHAKSRPEKLPDGGVLWHGFLIDITETKHAELQLRAVNELSEAIFEAANMSIISTDKTGLIKTFNRGAENLLGYKASEVINIVSPIIFHLPEEIQKHAAQIESNSLVEASSNFHSLIAKMADAEGSECECIYKRKDGSLVPVSLSFTSLRDAEQQSTGYLIVGRDVTDIKRAERLKNELISTVSHALRTPLTAITGSLGILAGGAAGELPETAGKLLGIAQNNSQRLTHLANDLLDLEKLSSGIMDIHLDVQALKPLLDMSIESFRSAKSAMVGNSEQPSPSLIVTQYPEEEIFIAVDLQRFQQVMDNFLSNAQKFSSFSSHIEISVTTQFNRVRIAVSDEGIGVPEEFQPHLFEKFAQANNLELRMRTGSGLGLAINKEIAERMGAQVGYEARDPKGSVFYIELDYANTAQDAARISEAGQWADRILIAEQDTDVAELLAIMLRTYHYRVDVVHSGLEALEKIALHNFQAVILDTELPDRDGDQLVHSIKRDVSNQRVPIILLSNLNYEQQRKKILDPLFKDVEWLPKPPSVDELMSTLHKLISHTEKKSREH